MSLQGMPLHNISNKSQSIRNLVAHEHTLTH